MNAIIQTFFPLPLLANGRNGGGHCGECTVENIDKGEGREKEGRNSRKSSWIAWIVSPFLTIRS